MKKSFEFSTSRLAPPGCALGVLLLVAGCAGDANHAGSAIPAPLQQHWEAVTADPGDPALASDSVAELEARADALYNAGQYRRAHAAYLELARTGDKFSQYRVAYMYQLGQGVEPDIAWAFAWASLAAELDDPRLEDYARHITERLVEAGERDQQRAGEHAEQLFANYSTRALMARRRDLLEQKLKSCTGSRIGSCYGSANVSQIDSAGDAAAWARLTSSSGGLGSALGRLRSQDGAQFWSQQRDQLWFFDRWLRDLAVPAGRIEYGPLILKDGAAPDQSARDEAEEPGGPGTSDRPR